MGSVMNENALPQGGILPQSDVVIVGGGPTGLFLALRLIRKGISVTVIEKEEVFEPVPRALGYFGPVQSALDRAGIWEDVCEEGWLETAFSWRKIPKDVGPDQKDWGDLIAVLPMTGDGTKHAGEPGYGVVVLGQHRLRGIIFAKLQKSPLVDIRLGYSITELKQYVSSAEVTAVHTNGQSIKVPASFVVGSDGGKSATRKLLGLPLEGRTWPDQIVAVDLNVDIKLPTDGPAPMYTVHPKHWSFFCPLVAPREHAPLSARITLSMPPEECERVVLMENIYKRLAVVLPSPRTSKWDIIRATPYRVHQRVVPSMFVGRSLLVGDAAHLNAPWGGLGLATGILDADSLADALEYVLVRKEPISLLEQWSKARVTAFKDIVDPISTENKLRCHDTDPNNPSTDPFFRALRKQDNAKELQQLGALYDKWPTNVHEMVMGQS